MNYDESINFSESECTAEFTKLFPPEYWNTIAMAELAPLGWEQSELRFAFHPTLEQVYKESLNIHRNLEELRRNDAPISPEPTLEKIGASYHESTLEPQRELNELLGRCLWDVFSDNHEVVSAQHKILDLGSFRGSGAFIAEYLNRILNESRYDYMDFYLGSIWLGIRVDLAEVYVSIFRRLKEYGFDWIYHFPRLGLVDLRPMQNGFADENKPEWMGYSPEEALAKQQADQQHDAEVSELRESLDAIYRESIEEARQGPPPPTVLAYRSVYGHDPRGWPPVTHD
jgi:hypothetical protein